MEKTQELIENEFSLLCATGVEDQLQDKVSKTIEYIRSSGIKVWVLTGDKVETAINIAYSSSLISANSEVNVIDGETEKDVLDLMDTLWRKLSLKFLGEDLYESIAKERCIVITGFALQALREDYDKELVKFLEIAVQCCSVLVCRASPKQKLEILQCYRALYPKSPCLAIGDGANDVNMITAANVGVGVKGSEGNQAARASDYVIGEFKLLKPLIFYFGRESYRKNANLILYNFYKNILIVLPQFWFGIFSGFSALFIYDTWIFQLFNIVFTSLPIVIYSLTDLQFPKESFLEYPALIKLSIENKLFRKRDIWICLIRSVIHAAIIQSVTIFVFADSFFDDGTSSDCKLYGMLIFWTIILVSNLKIITFTNTYSAASILVMLLSCLSFWAILALVNFFPISQSFGYEQRLFNEYFSFCSVLICVTCTFFIDLAITKMKGYKYNSNVFSNKNKKKEYKNE